MNESQHRILLMYISKVSGHRQATKALEKSFRKIDSNVHLSSVNGFGETFPVMEKVINALYMTAIRWLPQIWDWMYDNPKFIARHRKTKERVYVKSREKIRRILEEHKPDTIICSQAFPCGMAAHYKKTFKANFRLIAILTDYAPHSYWIEDGVDGYAVPSQDTKDKLIAKGVPEEKIHVTGIPIRYTFAQSKDRNAIAQKLGFDPNKPTVLVMGGGHGLGPIKKIVTSLLSLPEDVQLIAIAGANQSLMKWLTKTAQQTSKTMLAYDYNPNIDELMEVSDLIVTKPGGMTTAECLAKGLPMVIVRPLPGQEKCNAQFLVDVGAGMYIQDESNIGKRVLTLLQTPGALDKMKESARAQAFPYSADNIAKLVLNQKKEMGEERKG